MALTADLLKANNSLSGLTDEQITAITTLSQNDENTVIGNRIGEVHGNYQRDAEEATGLKQPQGMKTYDWLKSDVFVKAKASADLETKITTLTAEKKKLEDDIKKGSTDETLKQKVTDLESELLGVKGQLETKETEHKAAIDDANKRNMDILLEREFDSALIGVKFKDEAVLPKAVRDAYIKNAKAEVLAGKTPDFIDDGAGGKLLVFRDEKGEILRNKDNSLNPFNAKELLTGKITDVIETGKQQGGTGGNSGGTGGGGNGGGSDLDLSGIATRVQATDRISEHLMAKGLVRGTEEFSQEQSKLYTENKVNELPMS